MRDRVLGTPFAARYPRARGRCQPMPPGTGVNVARSPCRARFSCLPAPRAHPGGRLLPPLPRRCSTCEVLEVLFWCAARGGRAPPGGTGRGILREMAAFRSSDIPRGRTVAVSRSNGRAEGPPPTGPSFRSPLPLPRRPREHPRARAARHGHPGPEPPRPVVRPLLPQVPRRRQVALQVSTSGAPGAPPGAGVAGRGSPGRRPAAGGTGPGANPPPPARRPSRPQLGEGHALHLPRHRHAGLGGRPDQLPLPRGQGPDVPVRDV